MSALTKISIGAAIIILCLCGITLSDIKAIKTVSVPDMPLNVKFSAQDTSIVIQSGKGIKKLNDTDYSFGDYTLKLQKLLHPPIANYLKLDYQGKYWLYGDQGCIFIYDVDNYCCEVLTAGLCNIFEFSPSGNYLAGLCGNTVKVWNLKYGINAIKEAHSLLIPSKYASSDCKIIIVLDKYVIIRGQDTISIMDFKENRAVTVPLNCQLKSNTRLFMMGKCAGKIFHWYDPRFFCFFLNSWNDDVLMLPDIKAIAQPIYLDELEIPISKS